MRKKIYEILRMYVAKRATHNLGKVEITDDEIICYVDGNKLKRQMSEKYLNRYNIILHSIQEGKEIYKTYNLDKPVHYIIKNIDFDKEINIMASMKRCHVTFEECSFKTWISISFADYITFKNNTYSVNDIRYSYSIIPHGQFCISARRIIEVNKLEFVNDKIKVQDVETIEAVNVNDINKKKIGKNNKKSVVEMWLVAKEILFINSDIINVDSLELNAEKLTMENSNFDVKEISIYTDDIMSTNSSINTDIADINCGRDDAINQIQCIDISYNNLFVDGIEVNRNDGINRDVLELQQERLKLISVLKRVECKCEEQIAMEIKKQPLKRVLKK